MDERGIHRRFYAVLLYFCAVLTLGACGYAWIEQWSLADGFYMTLITMASVGYGETHPLSPVGRLFTCGLIGSSLVVMAFWTACLTSLLIEGDITGKFAYRRMLRMIGKMRGHTVVCGANLMAQAIVERLQARQLDVVVVTPHESDIEQLQNRFPHVQVITGDATNDLTLSKANVLRASHVVAVTDSEVDNLLISISCKDLGRAVSVLARAESPQIANRMRKAGVDAVISSVELMGLRVAELVSLPAAATLGEVAGVN